MGARSGHGSKRRLALAAMVLGALVLAFARAFVLPEDPYSGRDLRVPHGPDDARVDPFVHSLGAPGLGRDGGPVQSGQAAAEACAVSVSVSAHGPEQYGDDYFSSELHGCDQLHVLTSNTIRLRMPATACEVRIERVAGRERVVGNAAVINPHAIRCGDDVPVELPRIPEHQLDALSVRLDEENTLEVIESWLSIADLLQSPDVAPEKRAVVEAVVADAAPDEWDLKTLHAIASGDTHERSVKERAERVLEALVEIGIAQDQGSNE